MPTLSPLAELIASSPPTSPAQAAHSPRPSSASLPGERPSFEKVLADQNQAGSERSDVTVDGEPSLLPRHGQRPVGETHNRLRESCSTPGDGGAPSPDESVHPSSGDPSPVQQGLPSGETLTDLQPQPNSFASSQTPSVTGSALPASDATPGQSEANVVPAVTQSQDAVAQQEGPASHAPITGVPAAVPFRTQTGPAPANPSPVAVQRFADPPPALKAMLDTLPRPSGAEPDRPNVIPAAPALTGEPRTTQADVASAQNQPVATTTPTIAPDAATHGQSETAARTPLADAPPDGGTTSADTSARPTLTAARTPESDAAVPTDPKSASEAPAKELPYGSSAGQPDSSPSRSPVHTPAERVTPSARPAQETTDPVGANADGQAAPRRLFARDLAPSPLEEAPVTAPRDAAPATQLAAARPLTENAPALSTQSGDRIMTSAKLSLSKGGEQIEVRLDPPDLGKILITFRRLNGVVEGIIETEKPQTRRMLEDAAGAIVRQLADAGVVVRRFQVGSSPEGGSTPQPGSQGGSQGNSPYPHYHASRSPSSEFPTDAPDTPEINPVEDDALDLLA